MGINLRPDAPSRRRGNGVGRNAAAPRATSTLTWTLPFSNVGFAPGNVVAAQAVALFDPAMPLSNGESGGYLLSNGVVSVTHLQ